MYWHFSIDCLSAAAFHPETPEIAISILLSARLFVDAILQYLAWLWLAWFYHIKSIA